MYIKPPYLLFLGDIEDPRQAKTASGVYHWSKENCVAQYRLPGCAADLGLPDMTMEQAKHAGIKTLVIGLAAVGGDIPENWIPVLENALKNGFDIASGMHIYLNDRANLKTLAMSHGCQLFDVRRAPRELAVGTGKPRTGKRLLAVGTDCGVGKMFATLAIEKEMNQRGMNASFRATGQTGILIAGSGICIDAVIADFISGAAEHLSPDAANDHWDIIEGQGSLLHPSYAGVSLGLLHGSQPDALVICHDASRDWVVGLEGYPVPSLEVCMEANLSAARLTNEDVYMAGICLNCSALSDSETSSLISTLSVQFGLPVCDPVKTGVGGVVDFLENEVR